MTVEVHINNAYGESRKAVEAKGVPSTVALGDLLQATQRIERREETDEDLMMIFAPGSSLGGARPKASVYDQLGNLSIAKFPKERDDYSMERWEAIVMDMAQVVGIEVAEHQLVQAAGQTVFLSRRFDRIHCDGEDDQRFLDLPKGRLRAPRQCRVCPLPPQYCKWRSAR